ncbi:MAG: hypothetical protein GY885_09885 [Phycisphaeraceae bacterium]|nr:hypothetical protein [Phycisphaeraceae bacterium]MCP4796453.1 hypothetical protein [Phycisphaeraceae bacterium]
MTTTTNRIDVDRVVTTLVAEHGETARDRAHAGVSQCAERWLERDGDHDAFERFCQEHFAATDEDLGRLLDRLETALEQVRGHLYEMRRNLRRWNDLVGDSLPKTDALLATFDPAPDLAEQSYAQKLAFVALLNLRKSTLDEMLEHGADWTPERWAEARIVGSFGPRIPKDVADLARTLQFESSNWVANFHIPVGTMVDATGRRWFEADRALLAHWLVREEIKAGYNDPEGVHKQRALAWVMGRHVDGTIPASVMDGASTADWDPAANTIDGGDPGPLLELTRYDHWMDNVKVARALDEHHPDHPTAIDRKFGLEREIPEAEVERLLVDLLAAPVRRDLASLLSDRLGRPLEAHDVYFDDLFETRDADAMNEAVRRLCTDEAGFQAKLPEILRGLGWPDEDADFLGTRVRVEIARGSGHAMRPQLPEYGAWLRTNRLKDQLGWDGFDTGMHELGHNLEQLCSTFFVPRPAMRGVPNTACTEAFAFLYQSLAKRVLGIEDGAAAERAHHEETVASMLMACQIAGPSLVELRTWRWIYETGDACDAAGIRDAVLRNAKAVWDEFFLEDYGVDPYHILGAYQHMLGHPLYLADYAIGRTISHQIRSFMQGRDLATETRRICSIGRMTPDAWMRIAVGGPLSAAPLIKDTGIAIEAIR